MVRAVVGPGLAALLARVLLAMASGLCLLAAAVFPGVRASRARTRSAFFLAVTALLAAGSAAGDAGAQTSGTESTLRVGPQREIATLAAAARVARDGAVIEVDAGTYRGDVAVWSQSSLTLRAVGGRVRLVADGQAAEGKGIWVVRSAGTVTVEGFDFEGAVAASHNGAGIRFEGGRLVVRDCTFRNNEMGILTANDGRSELEIESSEFAHNSRPDGQSHNLYVGAIARFSVTGSYFHHASIGHLLKSRAAHNRVLYNRLTDEGGSASYELEFPNGGVAIVVGNVIRQSPLTDNPAIVSYGAEGYTRPVNELRLMHNTLIDDAPRGGPFVRVRPGAASVQAYGNVYVGKAAFTDAVGAELDHNFAAAADDFVDLDRHDYRLRPGSALGRRMSGFAYPGDVPRPTRQYVHPRSTAPLRVPPADPGAVQRASTAAPRA